MTQYLTKWMPWQFAAYTNEIKSTYVQNSPIDNKAAFLAAIKAEIATNGLASTWARQNAYGKYRVVLRRVPGAKLPAGFPSQGFAVTIGSSNSIYGWSVSGAYGSITGSAAFPNGGQSAISAYSYVGTYDFHVGCTGYTGTQTSAFTSCTVINQAGNAVTFYSANATYASGSWSWGTGSNPAWTAAGPTRQVIFS